MPLAVGGGAALAHRDSACVLGSLAPRPLGKVGAAMLLLLLLLELLLLLLELLLPAPPPPPPPLLRLRSTSSDFFSHASRALLAPLAPPSLRPCPEKGTTLLLLLLLAPM